MQVVFSVGETQLGKKLTRLDWEKAVYRSLFALANTLWSILKTFYSGTKMPLIPPIIIDNKVITNFREKANFFNIFFASQCMLIVNDSILPSTIMCRTEKSFQQ